MANMYTYIYLHVLVCNMDCWIFLSTRKKRLQTFSLTLQPLQLKVVPMKRKLFQDIFLKDLAKI